MRLRLPKQATQPDSNDQFLAGAGKCQRILSSVFAQQFRHVKRRNLFERPAVEGDSFVPALMPAFGFCWPKARLDAASTSPAKPHHRAASRRQFSRGATIIRLSGFLNIGLRFRV